MKLVIAFLSIATFAFALASSPHPCQCWPDWHPVKEEDVWLCKDQTSAKTFLCNIDIPPICKCSQNGVVHSLPLGEVNCVAGGNVKYDSTNCQNSAEWDPWFTKYPQYRLHH